MTLREFAPPYYLLQASHCDAVTLHDCKPVSHTWIYMTLLFCLPNHSSRQKVAITGDLPRDPDTGYTDGPDEEGSMIVTPPSNSHAPTGQYNPRSPLTTLRSIGWSLAGEHLAKHIKWRFYQGFRFKIIYRPGKLAVMPDMLSRRANYQSGKGKTFNH